MQEYDKSQYSALKWLYFIFQSSYKFTVTGSDNQEANRQLTTGEDQVHALLHPWGLSLIRIDALPPPQLSHNYVEDKIYYLQYSIHCNWSYNGICNDVLAK